MQVLIRVAHVAAINNQRMIQQRSVAVGRSGKFVYEIRQHLHVILIDLRKLVDAFRILAMMRTAVETQRRSFALWIRAAREVARKQHGADPRDVGLEGESQKAELQFDMFVERLRYTDRHRHIGRRNRRSLHRDVEPPFDLTHILRVLIQAFAIGRDWTGCGDGRDCR